jgi:transposase
MLLYGGIDLHANNRMIVLLNEQDEVLYRKRLPNELSTILDQLAPYYPTLQGLAVESTYNWYWLVDGLMEAGYRVHLANPAAMQQYDGLKYTDDHSDARWLAHLLRLGVLPEGYIYPKAERAVRDLLRKRMHLVRQHTANVLSVQNILVLDEGQLASQAVLDGYKGQARAEPGFRFLKDPQFLASSLYLKKPERIMALLMVMTVCWLVYAALEYRIRTALKEHGATFPDQKGKRIQNPTARWVFHYFVGIHVLYIPGQGLMILNLTDEHQHLLQLLGKRYAWFYR